MILFDLKCGAAGHVFEGWFASSDEYERQRASGLLCCPLCDDDNVEKAVMAPAVAPKSNRCEALPAVRDGLQKRDQPEGSLSMGGGLTREETTRLMQAMAKAQAEGLANSEWVGRRFADEARAMHYGEEDARPIHGEVALKEARDLIEEGVEVAALPFPIVPPGAKN